MTRLRSSILPLSLLATSLLPVACGGSDSPPAVCGELESYTSTVTNQLSFATDIYPILTNTSATGSGCAQENACHGAAAVPINALGSIKLPFVFGTPDAPVMDAAMAKANLLMTSVNASGMQRVSPGSVKNSLMSYKISGKDGLVLHQQHVPGERQRRDASLRRSDALASASCSAADRTRSSTGSPPAPPTRPPRGSDRTRPIGRPSGGGRGATGSARR